ncbi:MAG: phosphate/phosphite/phosphonate ABC transporter substrate-binding protein [Herpetosiphonaceae bacterium]|nr:phosphate/phosphite/phosphonate ABC transporter substrate-binding protein [Herpetosiphonaceae bacterium]
MALDQAETLVLGAVAYDPKVVTIWEGFKAYFISRGLPFDYILFSNYERQVEALLAGYCHVAWNSPLAWIRAERMARAAGQQVQAIAMRDTDCDLRSVVVVRSNALITTITDLKGKVIAVGAIDSPQASLLPLAYLQQEGLEPGVDFTVQRHDVLAGKHGDHIGGERASAQALMQGTADAACLIRGNYDAFVQDRTLTPGSTRVIGETGPYDHCNFTVGPGVPSDLVQRFHDLLLGMSFADPDVRPLMELEGVTAWQEGRVEGYRALDAAVDQAGFYDERGTITEGDYHY